MQGKTVEVFVIHTGPRIIPEASNMGVFLNYDQAKDYLVHEVMRINGPSNFTISGCLGFQPEGEDRVFLILASAFELVLDYQSDEARKRFETHASAWAKLTPDERAFLNMKPPDPLYAIVAAQFEDDTAQAQGEI